MKKFIDANKKRWDELAEAHYKGKGYNVKEFIKGGISISDIELHEVGDVKGKRLLHLQCHFGKDTLSWARLGATVTGVDFSGRAIELAQQLSNETDLKATFIQSEISKLEQSTLVPASFDIVFTSHGAIYWLPDLQKWAELIYRYLKPGGFFYIADSHPTGNMFDDEHKSDLVIRYPYFHSEKPLDLDVEGSYAEVNVEIKNKKEYGWVHNMGYIINSLIKAGLQIEFLHEYPFVSWQMFPFLVEKEGNWWHLPEKYEKIPLTFTLKAIKPLKDHLQN
ncbi:MAG: class I SAM-dependent methyltransferase [Candidatus Hodarchaeales archaeon]|jgi:SAM-dependent methyltransferase